MSIKNLRPNPNSEWKQGYFRPHNPEKYVGDPNKIICRSSWEERFCTWCDNHPNIVQWSSEPIAIPYMNPCWRMVNGKFMAGMSKYWVDFWIVVEKDGVREKWLCEVKPNSQIPTEKHIREVMTKLNESKRLTEKKLRSYNKQLKVLLVNKAKFLAAIKFASERGCKFRICDENFLF
jgi:hypothetical protein